MVHVPTARQALSKYMVVLQAQASLMEAIDILVRKGAQGAPVLDADGALMDILAEKDCLRLLSNSAYGEMTGGKVEDYMSAMKVTLTPDMDIFAVADAFLQTNFPILPVLDHGKLIGRVGRLDALRQIQELERNIERERALQGRDREERGHPPSIDQMQRLADSHTPQQFAELLRDRNI